MRLLALFFILMVLAVPGLAGTGTITITNQSGTVNITQVGVNIGINAVSWLDGDGIKKFTVNVTNASDTLTFDIGNMTAYRVEELKLNSTAYFSYQANSTGRITFTYIQPLSNQTYYIAPAVERGIGNYTHGFFRGNGSGLSGINPDNLTGTRYKTGSFTRDISLTTTQAVTGVGFKPKAIMFIASVPFGTRASIGFDDGILPYVITDTHGDTAGSWAVSPAGSIYMYVSANYSIGLTQSFDNDGFTLTWSKTGSPSGNATIDYMAYR